MVRDDLRRENQSTEGSRAVDTPVSPMPPGQPPVRFAFVDGLRGLAALGIVLFHIWWYEPVPLSALETTHWTVDAALLRTRGGVQILLVISGFVIAYTLRHCWFSRREVCSFVGRRLVRLVPAYWVTISIVLLVDLLCRELWQLPSPFDGPVTMARTTAHMVFLQDVLAHQALGAGMWTLCIEMQFYIVAVLGWGLAQRLFPRPDAGHPRPSIRGVVIIFAPAAFGSLFYWRLLESTTPWVTHFLWMFFLGMTTWWTLDRTLPLALYAVIVLVGGLELVFDAEWRYENGLALTTALAIFAAGSAQRLHVWLNWRPLQYLGCISYSLYLIHFPVCHLVTATGWKWFDDAPSPLQAKAVLLLAVPASILAGHLMYVLVEAPSARWAGHLKQATASHPISVSDEPAAVSPSTP